jgi:hypothetical protein
MTICCLVITASHEARPTRNTLRPSKRKLRVQLHACPICDRHLLSVDHPLCGQAAGGWLLSRFRTLLWSMTTCEDFDILDVKRVRSLDSV